MKKCIRCEKEFPSTITVEGKRRNLANRVYCFQCSPFRAGSDSKPVMFRPSTQRTWGETEFIVAVSENVTISGVLRDLGLSTSPGNFKTFKRYCQKLSLDVSHMTGRASSFKGNTRSLSDILVVNSDYASNSILKKRLLKAKLFEEKCYECSKDPSWMGKKLTLQLDHINGVPNDNRIGNLRLLCPNCHSQTETYSRKLKGNGRYKKNSHRNACCNCRKLIDKSAVRCVSCHAIHQQSIGWPPAEELEKEVIETSYMRVAKRLGVSDNAIRKYLNRQLGRVFRKMGRLRGSPAVIGLVEGMPNTQ